MNHRSLQRCFLFLLVLTLSISLFPQRSAAIQEKVIRVGWFIQPGYQELDADGDPNGFNYEYLLEIAKHTNWTYDFITKTADGSELTWADSLSMLENGELDLMGCLLASDQRDAQYGFSTYAAGQITTSLFVRSDSLLTSDDFGALAGVTVAAVTATLNDDDLMAYAAESGFSIGHILDCADIHAVEEAVISGKAQAGVISSYQPSENTRVIASFAPRPFYFATAKSSTALLTELNHAMNAILIGDPYYAQNLAEIYQQTYNTQAVYSQAELAFIAHAQPVSVCFSDAWAPLLTYDKKTGELSGVVDDVLDKISEETGLKFTYHHVASHTDAINFVASGQCDILACCLFDVTQAKKVGLSVSNSYMNLQLVQVARRSLEKSAPTIGVVTGLPDFYGTVAKGDGATYQSYDTVEKCFEALRRGEVDEIIVNSFSASYYMSLSRYASYIRSPLQGVITGARMAIAENHKDRNLLLSVLNKALSTITYAEINESFMNHSIESTSTLESMINRIPTATVALIAAIAILLVLFMAVFIIAFAKKSRQSAAQAEHINKLLSWDSLTGLRNENGFLLAVPNILAAYPALNWFIVDFDVDNFEHYNALFGFDAGNQILHSIADITTKSMRDTELCARIHADHFICLVTGLDVDEIRTRILTANGLSRSLNRQRDILLSYGIYQLDDFSAPVSAMCDRAQAAKRTIKGNFDNFIGIYNKDLYYQQLEDAELVSAAEFCLSRGEFIAYYQPKYDAQTEKIVGAEALVRWQHGEEFIRPDRFISLFETNGLIGKLDFYMLNAVCRHLREQLDSGIHAKPISLNFSRNHLYDDKFLDKLSEPIAHYRIPSELIVVEFTEYACLEDGNHLRHIIDGVHAMGIKLSIDDFGSGYSSLNILKSMNFDEIKLDRVFLNDGTDTMRGNIIIGTVLRLAKRLDLQTVVEGVETREQFEFVREYGGDVIQGYLFSRPVSGMAYDHMLQEEQAL